VRGEVKGESEAERRAGRAVAVEAARELAGYAAGLGVSLVVEPINRYETKFLNTIDETLEFIAAVGASNVGLVADTFHMSLEEEGSLAEALCRAGDRLWHVHLVDSNRCAPGMGHLDFEPVLAALRQMGYRGYLSAEILPRPDDETAAQRWIEAVSRLTSN
jgi:sugar phosphate isomerase/epimerase